MKQEIFEKIVEEQIKKIKETLLEKQKQYATVDRLHNFRTAAILQDSTMEQALGGMLCKHTISIYDMINSGDQYPIALWDEKITDHLVYLILLKAVISEDFVV